ncbi:MAG: amidohydrolase family protein [Pseudomonadota bacterium]
MKSQNEAPVIDFHVHVTRVEEYSPRFVETLRNTSGNDPSEYIRSVLKSPGALLDYLEDQGVDYAVCLAEINPLIIGTSSNDRVAEFCSSSPRLIPFACVNPYVTTDLAGEMVRCFESGHRGFKLYPVYQHFYPNDRRLYPFYARAEELKLPIMFHTGTSTFPGSRLKYGDPLFLDDLAVDFPALKIVMAHSGRGFWYDRAFSLARLHEHVIMEISGLPPQKLPDYFPDLEKLQDKILFGSDWPALTDVAGNITAIRALPISEEAKDKVLGLNAKRLLGLP